EGIDRRREVTDLEDPTIPAGGAGVGIDADYGGGPARVYLLRQHAHEVGHAALDVWIARVRPAFKVHVHSVQLHRRHALDRVRHSSLRCCRVGNDLVDGGFVELLDHQEDAVAGLVGAIDGIDQVLAGPACPPGGGRVEVAVAPDVQSEIRDSRQQVVTPAGVLRQLPVRPEAEDVSAH